MAFNFCSAVFKTTASCDTVTVDGYEATNLVTTSSSPWSTSQGFLVENFVRRPACITFEFSCNIEVERVVIHGVVGSQRSCGYEILSLAQMKSGHKLFEDDSTEKNPTPNEAAFMSIGKFNKLEAETFTFRNNRFRKRRQFANIPTMTPRLFDPDKHVKAEFRSRNVMNLTRISHLTVRVNRVVPGCVAAVKWIEIWGQPSTSTSTEVVERILQINGNLLKGDSVKENSTVSVKGNDQIVDGPQVPAIDETKVPNEFLDAITIEIMMIPMLLPSGYTVDKRTIERHNKEQAIWGRVPNDPFTGKSFTEKSKPVSNAALKVRIDQFLLKYGSDVSVNARTVGAGSKDHSGSVSSLVKERKLTHNPTQQSAGLNTDQHKSENPVHRVHSTRPNGKRKRTNSPTKEASIPSKKAHSTTYNSVPVIDLTEDSGPADSQYTQVHSRNDHEKNLSSTLDDALDNALSALPTFSTQITSQRTKNACVLCDSVFETGGAYQLPCLHKLCRKCITQVGSGSEIRCSNCDKMYSRNSIVKVHL